MGLAGQFGSPSSNTQAVVLPSAAPAAAAHKQALQVDLEIDKEAANLTAHTLAALQSQMEVPVVADKGAGPLDQTVQIVPCKDLAALLRMEEAQVGERTVVDHENVEVVEVDPAAAAAAGRRKMPAEEQRFLAGKADNATPDE